MVMNNNNGTSNFTYSPFAFEKKTEEMGKKVEEKKSEEKPAGTAAVMGQLGVTPNMMSNFTFPTSTTINAVTNEKPVEKAPTYPTTSIGFGGSTFNTFQPSTTFNTTKPAETTTEIRPAVNLGSIGAAAISTTFGGNVTNLGKPTTTQSTASIPTTTFTSMFDKPKHEAPKVGANGGIAGLKRISIDKPAGDLPEKTHVAPIFNNSNNNTNSPRKSSIEVKPNEIKKEEYKPATFPVEKKEEQKPAIVAEKKEAPAKPTLEKKEAPAAVVFEKKEVFVEKKHSEVIVEKKEAAIEKKEQKEVKKEEKMKVEKAPSEKKEGKPKTARPTEATRYSSRARKPVQQVVVDEPIAQISKEIEIPKGSGIKLGEIEHVSKALQKHPATDSLLQLAHRIIFGKPGESLKRKANLRAFHGFPSGHGMTGMKEKLQKYSVEDLKDLAILFNLERSGDKNTLVERLTAFLQKPQDFGASKAIVSAKKSAKKTKDKKEKKDEKSAASKKVAGTKRKAPAKKEKKAEPLAATNTQDMDIEQPSSEQQQN